MKTKIFTTIICVLLSVALVYSQSKTGNKTKTNTNTKTKTNTNTKTPNLAFKDTRDGKQYKTATLNGKVWMAENIKFGDTLGVVYYDKKENFDKYGRLYDWKTALKLCPTGWHLPKQEEWESLVNHLGGFTDVAYKKMNQGGTSKFELRNGGFREPQGSFRYENQRAYFWTATNATGTEAQAIYFDQMDMIIKVATLSKANMLSVRCVKDAK